MSHALTIFQSFLTVAFETPKTSAAKVVSFFFAAWLAVFLFVFDHVLTSSQEFYVLLEIIRQSSFYSIFCGLIYCALEPFVRRWWSEYLISWSRLLAGDFRDPMVGRDILIGGVVTCLAGVIIFVVNSVIELGLGANPEIRVFDGSSWVAADSFLGGMATLLRGLINAVGSNGLGFLGCS